MKRTTFYVTVSLCVGMPVAAASAEEITPYTFDGGGVTSSGGTFQVTGSIGQPDAGELSGGSFILNGGFWDSTHPFVPVTLQSFEVVGGILRPRAPAIAGVDEPVRTAANLRCGTESLIADKEPVQTEPEEDPPDDPEASSATP